MSVTGNWRPDDLNNEADLVKEVAAGKAELGYIGARGFDSAGVNSFAGLQAPMLIDSLDLEAKVLATDWAMKLLDGPRSIGIVGLGYVQGELRQPLGITRDLAQVADFQGARIGARPSHVTEMTMQALGATVVAAPAGSVDLSGLDGLEIGMPGVAGNQYDKGAKSFTGNLVFWARPLVIFANAKWFDALTADQQSLLRAAATETDQGSGAGIRQSAEESRSIVCAGGLSITSASQAALDAFRVKLQPVIEEMAKRSGHEGDDRCGPGASRRNGRGRRRRALSESGAHAVVKQRTDPSRRDLEDELHQGGSHRVAAPHRQR